MTRGCGATQERNSEDAAQTGSRPAQKGASKRSRDNTAITEMMPSSARSRCRCRANGRRGSSLTQTWSSHPSRAQAAHNRYFTQLGMDLSDTQQCVVCWFQQAGMLNSTFLVASIFISLASLLYIFFWNRFLGTIISLLLRLLLWNKAEQSLWIDFGTLSSWREFVLWLDRPQAPCTCLYWPAGFS